MANDTARNSEETTKASELHPPPRDMELSEWLSFAKTQAIMTELLQFELDALIELMDYKAKSVIEAFEDIVVLMQQHPSFGNNTAVSQSLSNMVKSLQYQDIAKQKIENISNALNEVHKYAYEVMHTNKENGSDASAIVSDEKQMDQIILERSLEEMRHSMINNLEQLSKLDFDRLQKEHMTSIEQTESKDSNIELF